MGYRWPSNKLTGGLMTDLGGRPELYTDDLAAIVLARIAEGESVRTICKDEGMPSTSTFFKWIREYDGFAQQYAVAKEQSTDALFEDLIEIADNEVSQPLVIEGEVKLDQYGNPVMIKDNVSVNHAKLRVDTRKWALSKMVPKKYGDKVQTDHSGEITHNVKEVQRIIVDPKNTDS